MTQPAKTQEPSMEEILASIRRIIADDDVKPDASQPAGRQDSTARPEPVARDVPKQRPAPSSPRPMPVPKPAVAEVVAPAPAVVSNSQDDIDAMLAGLDAEPSPDDDVFELTEQMTVAEPRKTFQTVDPHNDIEFSEPQVASPAPTTARDLEDHVREKVTEEVVGTGRPLMSHSTMASVDSAFNALAQTVLSNNARTLEDLVKEMLRPMLKGWLDDNLPNLVEKIVRSEIERVSRGR